MRTITAPSGRVVFRRMMKTYSAQDAICEAVASKQQGLISRSQALDAGHSPRSIDVRLTSGRWTVVHPGVYRMRPVPTVWLGDLFAAYLWAGPESVISYRSAAALHGLAGFRGGPVHISTTRRLSNRAVNCHTFRPDDRPPIQWMHNLPVTRVNRTLYDLAAGEPMQRLQPAFDDAYRRDLFALPQLANDLLLRGRRGLAGTRKIRVLVAERDLDYSLTESELEGRMLALLRPLGIADLVVQHKVANEDEWIARVDFASPGYRLVIEVDGWRYHRLQQDLRSDNARERKLTLAGWRVLRFTWDDVVGTPEVVVQDVVDAMALVSRTV